MFLGLKKRLPSLAQRRFDAAFSLLGDAERSVLLEAHGGLERGDVDWDAEARAVDKLGRALELVTPERSERPTRATPEAA